MKTIVTHIHPDLDAITSTWLIKRFMPDCEDAGITFVSAGATFKEEPVDSDDDIIHVDTGLGRFDHHQTNAQTSATKKVFAYHVKEGNIPDSLVEPLEKLVQHVTEIDHFAEVSFPDPTADMYEFHLSQIIEGLNNTLRDGNRVMEA